MIFEFVKNNGYKWYVQNGIYFKGYFTIDTRDDECFRGEKALEALAQIDTEQDFYNFLVRINGVFSIVIEKNDCVYAAVDIARSIPLYFSRDGQVMSDNAQKVKELLDNKVTINENNFAFLCAAGYTIENSTAYAEIKQLDMGEMCVIKDNKVKIQKYFYHLEETENLSEEMYIKKLSEVSKKVFERIKTAIDGRPVVLSMSGGYDSRFVGCMLKSAGIEDVLCYTYGKKDSFEVVQSKKNAQMLGFRWVFIEYSDEIVQSIIEDVGSEYLHTNNDHDFCAYVQNFPAVKVLHEKNYIKPNSVFITGLCGDMPTGFYIEDYCENKEYNSYSAAEALYDLIFGRIKLKGKIKQEELDHLHNMVKELPIEVNDYQSWVAAVSAIHTGCCHSRQYLHMNDPHDFFGYEWLLPYWDKELLKIWYSIPASQKIGQKLYSQWLLNEICKPYGIGQTKIVVQHSSNVILGKIKHLVGGAISFVLLNLHIPFRRKYDYNNFAPLELKIFHKLKTRKWLKYSKANLTVLLNRYIIQERYGNCEIKRINKNIS